MIEQKLEGKQESLRGRKNQTSKKGGAPFGVDKEPTDYSTSNINTFLFSKIRHLARVVLLFHFHLSSKV